MVFELIKISPLAKYSISIHVNFTVVLRLHINLTKKKFDNFKIPAQSIDNDSEGFATIYAQKAKLLTKNRKFGIKTN